MCDTETKERIDMGVGEQFQNFRNNYLIPAATISSISTRYKRITKRLNLDFWTTDSETAHSLYVGSYGRDTAATGVSDLDIYFRLPYAEYEKYNAYQPMDNLPCCKLCAPRCKRPTPAPR
jgi:tRNA nucleotidyltransferase (CCA-adding enzyme)